MSIYEHLNYKKLVLGILQERPKKGYGEFRRIAKHLNINPVIVSQIFRGPRDLSLEQAFELSSYFGFSDTETKYFLALVQLERAGTYQLKEYFKTQAQEFRRQGLDLKNRVTQTKILSDEAKGIFYSQWYFSAIRLLTSVDSQQTAEAISEYLKLPLKTVRKTLDFLEQHELVVLNEGRYQMGPRTTHLESSSPHVGRVHINCRLRGMMNLEGLGPEELFYSGPMVLSAEDAIWIRLQIVELLEKVTSRVRESKSEKLACLNIDWFDFRGR